MKEVTLRDKLREALREADALAAAGPATDTVDADEATGGTDKNIGESSEVELSENSGVLLANSNNLTENGSMVAET